MNRKCLILFIFNLAFNLVSYSQIIYIKPQQPIFNYLSIELTDIPTGHPTLYWTPKPHNPLYPDHTGFIIYKKFVDALNPAGKYEAIDTIYDPNITSYKDITSSGNNEQLSYDIAAKGPTEPSAQTGYRHSNIFITSVYDSCNHKIDLSWENENNYHGWGNRIKKYNVYISNSSNLSTFTLLTSLPGNKPYTNISNAIENQDYYIYVEATKDTTGIGGIPYVTRSNLFYKRTSMPTHPLSMYVDSIIAEDKRTNIYFRIDPSTQLTNFQIVRWENADSVKSIFSSKVLHTFNDPSLTFYADTVDSWAARTRPFYYKIDALNACPKIVKITNHANSITPKVVAERNMKNRIEWDQLYIDTAITERKNNYARYRVIRYAYTEVPLPPVYLPETDQLLLYDDVHELEGKGFSIKFCYQIEGFERNLIGNVVMFSRSRIQCVEIIPGVTMPDAIIPTDSYSDRGNSRNILAPIITFKADYTLSVYNRWGNLIFTDENKGWDGHSNGQLAKEGTYIYRLVVHTAGNRDVIKEGSVVVIYK